jgi:hypothetical protein
MGAMKNAYKKLVERPVWNRQAGRPERRWENAIKIMNK